LSFALYEAAACVMPPHSCTAIGCSDGVFAELGFSDRLWPVGAYTLELQLDGRKRVCSFSFPADQPPRGTIGNVSCEPRDPGLNLSIEQNSHCVEERSEASTSQACEPIAGQYSLRLQVLGSTPAHLQLRLERDAVLVRQQDLTLNYVENQPNGPDCAPLCRQSNLQIRLD
jgi:hypothetical protein